MRALSATTNQGNASGSAAVHAKGNRRFNNATEPKQAAINHLAPYVSANLEHYK